jgi:hypothetical protein
MIYILDAVVGVIPYLQVLWTGMMNLLKSYTAPGVRAKKKKRSASMSARPPGKVGVARSIMATVKKVDDSEIYY